jgi:hypothetical protein
LLISGFTPDVPYGLIPSDGLAVAVVVGSVFLQATAPATNVSKQAESTLDFMVRGTPDITAE